jgi:hypothetical protein
MMEKIEIEAKYIRSGLLLETVYGGVYYHRLYIGYTKKQACKLFREYVKHESNK